MIGKQTTQDRMTWTIEMRSSRLLTLMAAMATLIAGCSASSASRPMLEVPTPQADPGTTAPSTQPSPIAGLGTFPEFPQRPIHEPMATSLQAVLDGAVKQGMFGGVTAAVIVAESGSWSGAAGVDYEGNPLTPDAQLLIASVGKTVTAAQVLRLVEEGRLSLDEPAADHLPPEIASIDANGATIRDVLGMRSGLLDSGYGVDAGSTPAEMLQRAGRAFPSGSEIAYANINYIMLGMIIEHVTGRPLSEALRSGVLGRPSLDGLVYRWEDALAADGGGIESDPASLARWGYELYGRSVLSAASLRDMTDFQGEFYGLGAIDLSQDNPATTDGYGVPAIGHAGLEPSIAVLLVAFPQTGVIVAVQTNRGTVEQVGTVAGALRDAAQP